MKSLEHEAMAGAWKCLCVNVMLQACVRLEGDFKLHKPGSIHRLDGNGGLDKEVINQRLAARDWIDGGVGAVTFEDCCEALQVDPDVTRERILQYCRDRKRKPMGLERAGHRFSRFDPDDFELSVLA